jgi:hypothetical protein
VCLHDSNETGVTPAHTQRGVCFGGRLISTTGSPIPRSARMATNHVNGNTNKQIPILEIRINTQKSKLQTEAFSARFQRQRKAELHASLAIQHILWRERQMCTKQKREHPQNSALDRGVLWVGRPQRTEA